MSNKKQVPLWLKEQVYAINLKLVNECGLGWDEIIDFWQQILDEAKNETE